MKIMEQAYSHGLPAIISRIKPSFSTLVTERFYNDLVAEIDRYSRCEKVDIRPLSIKSVIVTKHAIDETYLYFDTLVNCIQHENGCANPIIMIVDAYFDLDEEFKVVHTRCAVPMFKGFESKAVLPDDLVPVIPKKQLDNIAVQLIKAVYPRSSKHADPIGINQVLHRLKLNVQNVHFDSDEGVMGKIFFENASTIVFDPETHISHIVPITAGTILINTSIGRILDERIRNNTIMHEVVHWMLHRPAFLLAKTWNHEYSALACRKAGSRPNSQYWSALDSMEWQANSLAPRMLMPDWATRFIAYGWLQSYSKLSPILRMEKTIDQLSRHFNVSRQLAKIRMIELGFKDANEAFSYYDRHHYTVSFENAAKELSRNKNFQNTLSSGIYAYVDNCFVIRDSQYIYRNESGILHLTSYAKAHMAECCLAFDTRRINQGMQHGMLRYNIEDETFISGSAINAALFAKQTKAVTGIMEGLPSSFSETLCAHMKRKGISVEQLAEQCLQAPRTISRYRNSQYPTVSLRGVIGLCIGLKLHPILANDLIQKAGYTFISSPEHNAYRMLILTMSNSSIIECNNYLVSMGVKALGREE